MPKVENESSVHQVYWAHFNDCPSTFFYISAGESLRGKRGNYLEYSLVFVDIVENKIGLCVSPLGDWEDLGFDQFFTSSVE